MSDLELNKEGENRSSEGRGSSGGNRLGRSERKEGYVRDNRFERSNKNDRVAYKRDRQKTGKEGYARPKRDGQAGTLAPAFKRPFRRQENDRNDKKELKLVEDRPGTLVKKSPPVNFGEGKKTVQIIPLGGLEQIGMNITAFKYGEDIIVVDCGLAFPEDEMLGIDLVIPDVTYLEKNIDNIKGFVFTHGHEDHIGAVPYILKKINVPMYATRLTMGLIESKLSEHGMLKNTKRNVVSYGETVKLGNFEVEFIRTNHSISDAAALAIKSPAGTIVHTGDFKVDYTPVYGDAIDLQRLGELGKAGVLALLCDSTNALKPGFTMSERTVGETFNKIFNDNKNRRIIVATFASNVDRVQQIINAAVKHNRKVCVEGRSMVNIIQVAGEMGYLNIPDGVLIETDEMKRYEPDQVVLITTGSQGESMAALSRMAANLHKKVHIQAGDCVVFSSTPIPGNEKSVSRIINELTRKGAKVIFQDTHVSGHACQEEIKLIYSLVKPKFAMPVHGEYMHLTAQKEIAKSLGMDDDHIIIVNSGSVVSINEDAYAVTDHVETGAILVDGLGVGDIGNIVLRDRQALAENGIVIVVLTLERYSAKVVAGPDIVSRGFVYIREAEDLLKDAKDTVRKSVENCVDSNVTDWTKIKTAVKDDLSNYFWKKIKRTPVILPIITEANR